MQFIRTGIEQIRRLLASLTTAAKVAIGLLVAMMAVALGLLIAYGGQPEMVAVFNAPLSGEELGHAEHVLSREDVNVKVEGGKLMVPIGEREKAFAALAYENLLPADSVSAFEELAKSGDWSRTDAESRRLWHQAKQAKLSQLVTLLPGVRKAQVILEEGRPRKLGTPGQAATASVSVTLRNGLTMKSKLRAGIADLIAGAVTGMNRADVSIIDATNGRSYRVREDDSGGSDALEQITEVDNYYRKKVVEHLAYIPNVIVTVSSVEDNTHRSETVDTKYDDAKFAVVDETAESMTDSTSSNGGEPGIRPNTGGRVAETAGSGGSSVEKTGAGLAVRFGETTTRTLKGKRISDHMFATVNVPLDYLVEVYKKRGGTQQDPGETELMPHISRIRDDVMKIVRAEDASLVKVDWFIDGQPEPSVEVAQAGMVTTVTQYGKPAALGVLAAGALVMVLMFTRRRHPTPPTVEIPEPFDFGEDTTVDVLEGNEASLEALELAEGDIRAQRIVEQVSQMVKDRPESATALVRRWIGEN